MSKSSWPFPTEQLPLPEVDISDEAIKEIDLSSITNMPSYMYSSPSAGSITINTSNTGYNGSWLSSSGAYNNTWVTSASSTPTLEVKGENADIKINGKSLKQFMETMESRLAILQPDLEKLEHFAALKKAYEHYKALEALCELPKKEDDNT